MDLVRLRAPFDASEIRWRVGQSGKKQNGEIWCKALAYITARAVQDRLDEVVGPENWSNQFLPGPMGGVICGLSIKIGDQWVTKWDGADNTDIESEKGGLSDAFKRAGVQWGIGRYLYNLTESWAEVGPHGTHSAKLKDTGEWFKWTPPRLPAWALPIPHSAAQIAARMPAEEAPPAAPPPAATPPAGKPASWKTRTPEQLMKAARDKLKDASNVDELTRIADFVDLLVSEGKLSDAQREELKADMLAADARIMNASPPNPENK